MSTNIVDSSNFLSTANYHPTGTVVSLNDGTELYRSGLPSANQGVILIPDYYGWHSGRVQNLADYFGSLNYLAIIPKFGVLGQEGQSKTYSESSGLMDWYKSKTFDGHLKPKISAVVTYMRTQGVQKICLLGFSWGGWVAANLLASECASDYTCAALAHPSLELEETLFGGSVTQLMNKISRPVLVLSDNEDPDHYRPYLQHLKSQMSSCNVIDYSYAGRNFLLHGNSDQANVREACTKSLNEINNFFQTSLSMFGQTKELAANVGHELKEKAAQFHDRMESNSKSTGQKFGEGLQNFGERIKQGAHNIGEKIGEEFKTAGANMQERNATTTTHTEMK